MELGDLRSDVLEALTPAARNALEELIGKYGASETFAFLLALAAGTTAREREVLRLFLRQLDEIAESDEEEKESS